MRALRATLALLASTAAAEALPAPDRASGEELWRELAPLATRPTTEHTQAQALPRVEGPFELDGHLDEAFWRRALIWELKYERKAKLNSPATQRTLFLAATDGEQLRLAFLALDDRIDLLRAPLTDRLSVNPAGDYVWVALTPLGDERSVYFLYLNARNVQADSFYEDGTEEDHQFDLSWDSGAYLGADHWAVEYRVPFKNLRFTPGAAWRIGAGRRQTREFAYFFWPLMIDPNESCFVCKYPAVRVETPDGEGGSLEAIPFGLAEVRQATDGSRQDEFRAGVDFKWRPSPSWVVDATLWPDFSQVESDELQLTSNVRFAPFVSERRPFFLERTDLFASPIDVAYTRSILDPDFGLRATGRVNRNTFALLSVQDTATLLTFPGVSGAERLLLEDRESLVTFASARRDIGSSKLALLFTDRDYSEGRNTVLSASSKIQLDKTWNLELQGVASRTRYPDRVAALFNQPTGAFEGLGSWARLEHKGREWTHSWTLEALDENLRADAGFLQQVDYQRLTVTEWWHNWVENGTLRDHGLFVEAFATRSGGRTRDWEVWVGADWTLRGETYLDIGWIEGEDTVTAGRLPYGRGLLLFSSSPTQWLSLSGRASYGTAIDYALELEAEQMSWTIAPEFALFDRLTISSTLREYQLSDGALLQRQRLVDVRAEFQITPRFGLRQIAQRDDAVYPDGRYRALDIPTRRRTTGYQSLLRYRISYGTVGYLGVYESRSEQTGSHAERDRGAFLKISYLWSR